jgi:hypothetical protein
MKGSIMHMSHFRRNGFLEKHGFNLLTGEACGVGMRILTDVKNREAARQLLDFIGVPALQLAENWNSGSEFSVMLPYCILDDFAVWLALMKVGCHQVILCDNGDICGWQPGDEDWPTEGEWEQHLNDLTHFEHKFRRYTFKSGPRAGSRMVHAMTGRTV